MRLALAEAKKAFKKGEIPVGAVIVKDGVVISNTYNKNRNSANVLKHAEMIAIDKACRVLKNERLTNCELYITKEPCAMCAGAIVHARIKRLVIALRDSKYGACGTALSVCGNKTLNHIPNIEFGILQEEAQELLKSFFKKLRTEKH